MEKECERVVDEGLLLVGRLAGGVEVALKAVMGKEAEADVEAED